jgi:hypothetical protein
MSPQTLNCDEKWIDEFTQAKAPAYRQAVLPAVGRGGYGIGAGGFPSEVPMQLLFLPLPTTEPSAPTKDSATTSTPWEATPACPEDGPIGWGRASRWIIGCLEAISITAIASGWHRAETSTPARHRTLTHWSCSIKSWHKNTSFLQSVRSKSLVVRGDLRPLLFYLFEPLLNLTQPFPKEIGLLLENPNLFFLCWRSPWCNGCSVPPGMPTRPSTVPVRAVSPSCRSHSVRHSHSSFFM